MHHSWEKNMKTYALWFALHIAMMGGVVTTNAAITEHAEPLRIGVAVDASFKMRNVWGKVPKILDAIAREHPSATFIVVTEPGRIGEWSRRPTLDGVRPFAPRRLEKLAETTLWNDTDKVYIITNEPKFETPNGWEVKHLGKLRKCSTSSTP